MSSVDDKLEWSSPEDRKVALLFFFFFFFFFFFYKIHSGIVSLDKDRYLTSNLRSTGASHDSQYTRYTAYSDAVKDSFFPMAVPLLFMG